MRTWIATGLLFAFTGLQAQQPWTLEQCVKRAEEKNIALLNAALDAELAGQAKSQAYWDLLPDLNAVGTHGYNYGRVIDRFTNTFATDRVRTNNFYLSSNVTLFGGLSKQNTIKRAGVDAEAAGKAIEAARNDIRLTTVQAFLDVVGLRERRTAAEAQAASTRQQIQRTTAMVEAGRLARADLLALESQLAQEEYTVIDLGNQHDQRMLALGRALQLDADEMRTFDIAAPAITETRIAAPTITAEEVLGNVLRSNPAYAQVELQAKSAEHSLAIAKAGILPSLTLNGSLGTGYSGRNYEPVGDPVLGTPQLIGYTESQELVYTPTYSYDTRLVPFGRQLDENLNQSVSFTLSVPLFNNMRNRYGISQARVQQEKARNSVTTVRNDLQRSVLDALVMLRSAHSQYLAASKSVEASSLSLEYAQERFAQGVITSIELNTTKAALNRATADMINAKYQYVMASKYLDILQGIPLTL